MSILNFGVGSYEVDDVSKCDQRKTNEHEVMLTFGPVYQNECVVRLAYKSETSAPQLTTLTNGCMPKIPEKHSEDEEMSLRGKIIGANRKVEGGRSGPEFELCEDSELEIAKTAFKEDLASRYPTKMYEENINDCLVKSEDGRKFMLSLSFNTNSCSFSFSHKDGKNTIIRNDCE